VTDWFLCEPEAMIMRHLPENPIWQLKYPVTTAEEFAQFPLFEGEYFNLFGSTPPALKRVNRVGGGVSFQMPTPKKDETIDYSLWSYPMKNGTISSLSGCIWQQANGEITIAFPKPGQYEFWIGRRAEKGARAGAEHSNKVIARVGFEATDSGLLNVPIPDDMAPHEFNLLEPRTSPLLANTKYRFRMTLPEKSTLQGPHRRLHRFQLGRSRNNCEWPNV
jgi:hypothetical protein